MLHTYEQKSLVDGIMDGMERRPAVRDCYDQWPVLQNRVDSYYHDKPRKRVSLSRQKAFRQIKNAVIQEAERLRLGEITFKEKGPGQYDEPCKIFAFHASKECQVVRG